MLKQYKIVDVTGDELATHSPTQPAPILAQQFGFLGGGLTNVGSATFSCMSFCVAALPDNTIIGMIGYYDFPADRTSSRTFFFDFIEVLPEYKRNRIGAALVQHYSERRRALGVKHSGTPPVTDEGHAFTNAFQRRHAAQPSVS
jgi:hypothetical protein